MHALAQPDHSVLHLRQKWPEASHTVVEDVIWIQKLADEGEWVIVSGDIRIRKRPAEKEALRAAKLTTFFLADGYPKFDKWEQVRWLIEQWPDIVDLAAKVAPGSIFRVPKRGKIETY